MSIEYLKVSRTIEKREMAAYRLEPRRTAPPATGRNNHVSFTIWLVAASMARA